MDDLLGKKVLKSARESPKEELEKTSTGEVIPSALELNQDRGKASIIA
jgi:hypothetical protein